MKVVFVAIGQEQLGLSYLSSVLRLAGHETSLVFDPALFHDRYYFDIPVLRDVFNRDDQVVEEILALEPDLLAFSVLTSTFGWCREIARRVKLEHDVPVVFGGVHPSAVPELCLEGAEVDYVCIGEGEEAIVSLAAELAKGSRPSQAITNLAFKGPGGEVVRGPNAPFIQDLDGLPLPDKALWEQAVRLEDNYFVITARGCPYRCSFCFNNYFAKLPGSGGGKYVRQRSVENVMFELGLMKSRYGYRHVEFTDDILTLNKKWMQDFLRRYEREIAVPFSCLVHPRFIDHDLARWLKDAGCDRIQMGIQSADEEYKRSQLLRMERETHLNGALEAMSAAGLSMKLDHILGLPGEPKSAQDKAVELFKAYPPARVNTYWLSYLPGTEIMQQAVDLGLLSSEDVDSLNRGEGRLFHHTNHWKLGDDFFFYQRYELLFRLLPLLPSRLRKQVLARHIPQMRPAVASFLGFACDLVAAAIQRDSDTSIYVRHYLHHLWRALPGVHAGKDGSGAPPVVPPQAPAPRRQLPLTG